MPDIEPNDLPDQATDLGIIGPQHYSFPEGYGRSHNLLSLGDFEEYSVEPNAYPVDYYKFAVPEGVASVVATLRVQPNSIQTYYYYGMEVLDQNAAGGSASSGANPTDLIRFEVDVADHTYKLGETPNYIQILTYGFATNNDDISADDGPLQYTLTVDLKFYETEQPGAGEPVVPTIDGLQYIASYADLITAFGANAAEGIRHFEQVGRAEGRVADAFDEAAYLAKYADLQRAFGNDLAAATRHYIESGHAEGRTTNPDIDGLQYIASNGDLILAFGANASAGVQHYRSAGAAEGRELDTFDEQQYLQNYPDLQAAFGADGQRATIHFITNGFAEGRSDDILI